jgi:hypothetical protein
VVGTDFPQEHLEFLESRGIDLGGIVHAEGSTFRWGGRYLESLNERETLYTNLGVFEGFRPFRPTIATPPTCSWPTSTRHSSAASSSRPRPPFSLPWTR